MPLSSIHVLYNQDCTDLFCITREPLEPRHVDRMVDEVAAGGADVFLVNPNALRANFPSRAWERFWDGYTPGDRAFFGGVPPEEVPEREHFVRQMAHLASQGCDYLAHALQRCRKQGIAPGVSVRMNDLHDEPWPDSHMFPALYRDHPELRLCNPTRLGWGGKAFNYQRAEVRAHYLRFLAELVTRYDLEVLELDFLRFTQYFPRPVEAASSAILTGFLREVRALLRQAGRPIALLPRVAATPAAALEQGCDVRAWAAEGLIDGLIAGMFIGTGWNYPVADFRERLGGLPLFVSADYIADARERLAPRSLPLSPALLRGFAAGHYAAGAHGVYFFNFFCSREEGWEPAPCDPCFGTLRDLRGPALLGRQEKRYLLTAARVRRETDLPEQIPVPLRHRGCHAFEILLAPEGPDSSVHAEVALDRAVPPEHLWLQLNQVPVGPARAVTVGPPMLEPEGREASQTGPAEQPKPPAHAYLATFHLPPEAIRPGRNLFTLRNEAEALIVLGVEVTAKPGEQGPT